MRKRICVSLRDDCRQAGFSYSWNCHCYSLIQSKKWIWGILFLKLQNKHVTRLKKAVWLSVVWLCWILNLRSTWQMLFIWSCRMIRNIDNGLFFADRRLTRLHVFQQRELLKAHHLNESSSPRLLKLCQRFLSAVFITCDRKIKYRFFMFNIVETWQALFLSSVASFVSRSLSSQSLLISHCFVIQLRMMQLYSNCTDRRAQTHT